MVSGYARNIVSDHTHLLGTVRAFSEENFNMTNTLLKETLTTIADEYGCSTEFSNSDGYPPVINDVTLYNEVLPISENFRVDMRNFAEPLVISEDFSFYGLYVPAAFFCLEQVQVSLLHSVDFDFDEKVLASGFELYKRILAQA